MSSRQDSQGCTEKHCLAKQNNNKKNDLRKTGRWHVPVISGLQEMKQRYDFKSKDLEEGGEELGPGVPGGRSSSQCILKTKRFYCFVTNLK